MKVIFESELRILGNALNIRLSLEDFFSELERLKDFGLDRVD